MTQQHFLKKQTGLSIQVNTKLSTKVDGIRHHLFQNVDSVRFLSIYANVTLLEVGCPLFWMQKLTSVFLFYIATKTKKGLPHGPITHNRFLITNFRVFAPFSILEKKLKFFELFQPR